MIEKDFHARNLRGGEALTRMFQHSFNLLTSDAGKPLEKIIYRRPVFQIFEQCRHRYARVFEQPRAAHFSSDTFNCGTFAPIQHDSTITLS